MPSGNSASQVMALFQDDEIELLAKRIPVQLADAAGEQAVDQARQEAVDPQDPACVPAEHGFRPIHLQRPQNSGRSPGKWLD
jgi:hypothetical protein